MEIDFNSATPPTQEQFNEFHKEPVDYGEDGDQMLGKQYTKEQAAGIFAKHWEIQTGEKPDFDVLASVIEAEAGWTEQPDKYEDGDYCFCWVRGSKVKPRYEAWLLWV
jgi:hypothetical protein